MMMVGRPLIVIPIIANTLLLYMLGIEIPGFSQVMFDVDEGDNLELCVDISSAAVERTVILSITTLEATAQGRVYQLKPPQRYLIAISMMLYSISQLLDNFLILLLLINK